VGRLRAKSERSRTKPGTQTPPPSDTSGTPQPRPTDQLGRTGHAGGRVSSADPLPAFDRVAGSATRRAARTANSHTGTPSSQGRVFRRCASEPCHTDQRRACGTAYSLAVVRPKLGEQGMPAGESAVRIRCRRSIGLQVLPLAAPPAPLTRTPERPLAKAALSGGVRVSRAGPLPAFDRVAGSATRRAARTANSHTGTPASQSRAFRRCASEPCHTDQRPACGTAYSPAVVRPKLGEQGTPAGESAVRIRCRRSIGLQVLRLAAPPARLTRTPERPLAKMGNKRGTKGNKGTQLFIEDTCFPLFVVYQAFTLWHDRPAASRDAGKENADSHYRRSNEGLTRRRQGKGPAEGPRGRTLAGWLAR